jgi:type IX secretion system PorP/SprF family membrane protein
MRNRERNIYKFEAFIILFIVFNATVAFAQHTPICPISNYVFNPFIFNPAITGSKDFMAIDLAAVIQGNDKSQLLSGNTRIAKPGPTYFGAPVSRTYTRFGAGISVFNDVTGPSQSIGMSAAASYHKPLNTKNLSFISAGLAIKGIYNMLDSVPDTEAPPKNTLVPNIDAGIYYYGQFGFAGISATNILGSMLSEEDKAIYDVPVSRQYFLTAGYKFIISRSLNVVLEPSIIVNLDDSLSFGESDTYNPMLKIYMEDFCVGTYFHDFDNLTFFFQYKFPQWYLGTLIDFPLNAPFYKEELIIEIAAGFNFGSIRSGTRTNWHW